ncbi:MAG TPA: hypothetical protein PLZ61_02480 [Candidatus Cryosericum sp.]|nr:hypothetical protein [Candidatus Cryosericum sp.]
MANPGDTVYPTPAQLRALGVWVQTAGRVVGMNYRDPDDEYDLLSGGAIGPFTITPESLRELGHDATDTAIVLRVAPINIDNCYAYEDFDFDGLNFIHREDVSIYGPEPAHDHSSWVGSAGAASPSASGEFAVARTGDDPPKLTLDIASGYEQRLSDIPAQDFPVGMPGAPFMYWTRRADAFRVYDGQPGGTTGNPYSVPAEGVYCWLGWAWMDWHFNAPAASSLIVTVTSRRYQFFDNHLTDSTRQTDFSWAHLGDEQHRYRLSVAAGNNHAYLCLMTPLATEVESTDWSPVGSYAFGRIDFYEGVLCAGECDYFTQVFWEQTFNAMFPAGWYTQSLVDMIATRPGGSSWVPYSADVSPVAGDILCIQWSPVGVQGHAAILHSIDGNDLHIANSNADGDALGHFSLMEYYSPNLYRWWTYGKTVLEWRNAGTSACDGYYASAGTHNGQPLYASPGGKLFWYSIADTRWVLSDHVDDPATNWYYAGPVGGSQYSLPLVTGALGADPPPAPLFATLEGWFHWDGGVPQPTHPVFERVVRVEVSGFADGNWQFLDDPRLCRDPAGATENFAIQVKSFEGHDPLYNKGGLSCRVDCAHVCQLYAGDTMNANVREKTLPFFDKLIGAVSGEDLTTAFSLGAMAINITDCSDAWLASEDASSIEAHTKDEDDNQLALWCFDICHPIRNSATELPLEQDPIALGNKLRVSLRASSWANARGIRYIVLPDSVQEGRAQGFDLYAVGSLARSRTSIAQVWRRHGGGTWVKYRDPVSSDDRGLWRSGSLPPVYQWLYNADYDQWYPDYWEYAVTPASTAYPTASHVIGIAPHRETVALWIVYREPGKGNLHIAFNPVAATALVVDADMSDLVGVHKLQKPLNAENEGGLLWSDRFPVEGTGDVRWANIAIGASRPWHVLIEGDGESTAVRPGLHLETQGDATYPFSESMGFPMAVAAPQADLLYVVARDNATGVAHLLRRDAASGFAQFGGEPTSAIGACDECAPSLAINPVTWLLAAAVQANDAVGIYLSFNHGQTWEAVTDGLIMRYPALWATPQELWLAGWLDEPSAGAEGQIILYRFDFTEYALEQIGDAVMVGASDEGRPGIFVHPHTQQPIILGTKTSLWDVEGPDLAIVEYNSLDFGLTWYRRGFIPID